MTETENSIMGKIRASHLELMMRIGKLEEALM
jgi:hypothetical protein